LTLVLVGSGVLIAVPIKMVEPKVV